MKKSSFVVGCLLLTSLLGGCGKKTVDTHANVSDSNASITNSVKEAFTIGDMYEYIVNNQQDVISKNILHKVISSQINLEDSNMKTLYIKYLNQYFYFLDH